MEYNKVYKYEDDNVEIIKEKKCYLYLKKENKYLVSDNIPNQINSGLFKEYRSKLPDFLYYLYLLIFIFLLGLLFVYILTIKESSFSWGSLLITYIIIFANIIIHELAHIAAMKFFGKKCDGFRLKWSYLIFVTFKVKLNEMYMLSKKEKIVIHSIGIFINLIILYSLIIILGYFKLCELDSMVTIILGSGILLNIVPIFNTDGKKILLTVLNKDLLVNKRDKLDIFFEVISYIIVIIIIIKFISDFLI